MKQEVDRCEVPFKIRFDFNSDGGELVSDWCSERRPSSSISSSSNESTFPCHLGWPMRNASCSTCNSNAERGNRRFDEHSKVESNDSDIHEIKLMKERFSKLLLGEDMSGSGKGVCTALAISNAITNLYATVFGQLWRLEPLSSEKKSTWLREMDWLLCVGDYIVELMPSWQTLGDGRKVEVMICRPRSDLFVNLPALHKLDNMLIEILDSFCYTEFWYIDQGVINIDGDRDRSVSCKKFMKRHKEKWWLPVPRISPGGLCEKTRKKLIHNRECANQILKAVQNINSTTLEDMEVPESYIQTLPKSGRTCLGEAIYRYITSPHFSPDCLLDCLNLSSEHSVLDAANCIEASIHLWTRKTHPKHTNILGRSTSKTSWEMVKDLVVERDKMGLLLQRAKSLLFCLKKRFPCLPQTSLDTSKIHFNKDVGRSILESYSRVLESLAFNIVARIEDVLFVDDLTRRSSGRVSPVIGVANAIAWRKDQSPCGTIKTTPYKATNSAKSCRSSSSVLGLSPGRGEGSPFLGKNTRQPRGFMVKRVLSSYLGEGRNKSCVKEG